MRWWFAITLVAACDGSTELTRDAQHADDVHLTTSFTPLLCTSGTAGEPTCPVNHVDVSELGAGSQLRLLVTPMGTRLFLKEIQLAAGSTGIHVDDLRFVVYRDGVAVPQLSPFPPAIDLQANEVLEIDIAALSDFGSAADQLGLQYGVVR